MTFFKTTAIAGAMLAMAGCVTDTGSTGSANFNGTYQLVDIDGLHLAGSATLTIDGQAIHGEGPCNSYNSQNNAVWPNVSLAGIAATRRACLIEGGENTYFKALEQVTQASLRDGTLELRGPGHAMRFTAE